MTIKNKIDSRYLIALKAVRKLYYFINPIYRKLSALIWGSKEIKAEERY